MLSVNEKTFSSIVLESPQPVLVYFWAPWCGLCRFVNPLLGRLKAEVGDSLQLVDVNADANFRLTNAYRLRSLPTLLLFHQGQVIQRLENFRAREDLQSIGELVRSYCVARSA
jgi:thioredoxin 1